MQGFKTSNYYLFSMVLVLLFSQTYADYEYELENSYCVPRTPSLLCQAFDLQIHAGIMPILWKGVGEIDGVLCPLPSPGQIIVKGLDFPEFDCLYKLPWVVGAQLGYSYSDSLRFYLEYNISQAKARSANKTKFLVPSGAGAPAGSTLNFVLSNYKLWSFNLGCEYYLNRWSDVTALFFGAKLGITNHKRVGFSLSETIPGFPIEIILVPTTCHVALFDKNIVANCGINAGIDFSLSEHASFVINAEIVANGGPRNNQNIMVMSNIEENPTTNLLVSQTDAEIRFPVTCALRFSF